MLTNLLEQNAAAARRISALGGGTTELIPGVALHTSTETTNTTPAVYAPMARIVFDGAMEVTIGANVLRYDPGTCFVGSIDLPVTSRITRASAEHPYLALEIALDRGMLADLLAEAFEVKPERGECYVLAPAQDTLLSTCLRILELGKTPEDARFMGSLLRRELLYRLLQGPQAAALHQFVVSDPKVEQLRRAITWIRNNLAESVPIADMANCAGMSQPTFRRHFRVVTGMSPLQYQKTLRLQAARRAILEGAEVGRAAFAVGYESASQFSREYSRTFGCAPSHEARRLHLA